MATYIWYLALVISGFGIVIGYKNVTSPYLSGMTDYVVLIVQVVIFSTSLFIIST